MWGIRITFSTVRKALQVIDLEPVWWGQSAAAFVKGSKDASKEMITFSDNKGAVVSNPVQLLKLCEPWENHIEVAAVKKIRIAIRACDMTKVRALIEGAKTDSAVELVHSSTESSWYYSM